MEFQIAIIIAMREKKFAANETCDMSALLPSALFQSEFKV
jgi:hypothetical protein